MLSILTLEEEIRCVMPDFFCHAFNLQPILSSTKAGCLCRAIGGMGK